MSDHLQGAIDISTMELDCLGCGGRHPSSKRLVPGYTKVYEIGLHCEQTGAWFHSFYVNEVLTKQRQAILKHGMVFAKTQNRLVEQRGRKAEKEYERSFKKFQAMMRDRLKPQKVATK